MLTLFHYETLHEWLTTKNWLFFSMTEAVFITTHTRLPIYGACACYFIIMSFAISILNLKLNLLYQV